MGADLLDNVQSGRNPEAAAIYMAPQVQAHHIQSLNGEAPTGAELIELTSVVYRVAGETIVEY
ncbi:hypothetical protein AD936_09815 [Gluconobacter japonicus]|nr:hypothetical protein AD936_09815 [Gluconobacter japonicus]